MCKRRARTKGTSQPPEIVCLSQATGPFVQLVDHLAGTIGPIRLYAGDQPERSGRVDVRRAPAYDNRSARSRLWTWARYLLRVGLACLFTPGRPVLFVTTNPPALPWLAWLLLRLRGWPYVVLVWDIYPDVLIRFGYLRQGGVVARAWHWLNRRAYARAHTVVTIGEQMAETIRQGLGETWANKTNIEIVPAWVDADHIRPIPKEDNWFASEQRLADKLTVLYSGNMGVEHDLLPLVQAAERLEMEPGVAFLLIGDGARKAELAQAVASRELSNVTLLPWQPWESVPYSLASGEVAVVALGEEAAGLSMPSKTYSMMAAGCAILALSSGANDLRDTVERHGCGLCVEGDDVDGIESALRRFLQEPDFLAQCRRNARRAAEEHFASSVCFQHYEELVAAAHGSHVNGRYT